MSSQQYFREYYKRNREQKLSQAKQWQSDNKEQRKQYMREYVKDNRDKFRRTPEQQAEYNRKRREAYAKCQATRDKARAKVKEWQSANPDKRKAQRIKKFGIALDEFQSMYERCGGQCEICGFKDNGDKRFFPFVDHCHTTGVVRGLLCSKCNFGVGQFGDNIETLRRAILYIEATGSS